jgi:hypothetical protein
VLAASFSSLKRSGGGWRDVRGQFADDFLGLRRDFQHPPFQKLIEGHGKLEGPDRPAPNCRAIESIREKTVCRRVKARLTPHAFSW